MSHECAHPPELVRHVSRGIYQCFGCGHTSHLKDRPYFCYKCSDVHSLTWEEMQKHRRDAHADG